MHASNYIYVIMHASKIWKFVQGKQVIFTLILCLENQGKFGDGQVTKMKERDGLCLVF